jgi:hypothetical protein
VLWDGENPEEGAGRENRKKPDFMECEHAQACETLLTRILELHVSGHTANEIAAQILTTEPENAMFRAALLVEMIIHCVGHPTEEENL